MSISNNDIIKCHFNNTLTITYSKKEPNIINGKKVKYITLGFQKIIESYFKNRPADIIYLNHNNTFNYIDNQYVQLLKTIEKAIDENKDDIQFICDVKREILCSICKQEWFIPRYSHINMCSDCGDCFFD